MGDPKIEIGDLPEKGDPLEFSFEVGVRPPAELGDYKKIEVGRREPKVDPEQVDAELERLRESLASLETVERAAAKGDFVVLDFVGKTDGEPFEGGEARGFMLELGSGRLIPGFEEQLEGASAGDERQVEVTFPEDYQAEAPGGQGGDLRLLGQGGQGEAAPGARRRPGGRGRRLRLPRRAEGRHRGEAPRARRGPHRARVPRGGRGRRRGRVEGATSRRSWSTPRRTTCGTRPRGGCAPRASTRPATSRCSARRRRSWSPSTRTTPKQALAREAVLAAIVEAEGIEVDDEEMLEALREAGGGPGRPGAGREGRAEDARARRETGRDDAAARGHRHAPGGGHPDESAEPISVEKAEAREKLWTPEKDAEGVQGDLDAGQVAPCAAAAPGSVGGGMLVV